MGSRSEVTLVGNCISSTTVPKELIACEVPQLEYCTSVKAILAGLEFFKLYEKRIFAASKKIQKSFTLFKLVEAFWIYERLHNFMVLNKNQKGELKVPLYKHLSNPCILLIAYSSLRKKSGGVAGVPVENVTLGGILSLSYELRVKYYQPKPVKCLYISKDSGQLVPLGLASTKDKIVQQVLITFLQPRFETIFFDVSHGFRPSKSCHSALKDIYFRWHGIKWFIECDFVKYFDKINHILLLDSFNRYVDDYWISNLIYKILKVGYIYFGGFVDSSLSIKMGTPQGSLLSPIFCNILLHEFDRNMLEYSKVQSNFVSSFWNIYEEYPIACTNLDNILSRTIDTFIMGSVRRQTLSNIQKLDLVNSGTRYCQEVSVHLKIQYIRYADIFLCGLISKKKVALQVLSFIAFYVANVGMFLNKEKTNVKHYAKGVYFLGYHIYGDYGYKIFWKPNKSQKMRNFALKLAIPLEKLFVKFCERGFFMKVKNKKSYKMVGRRVDKWLFLDSPYDVILRFNSVIKGVAYYYSGSTCRSVLDRFYSAMKRSAALTLAHMHKKHNAKWAFAKYGHELKVFSKTGKVVSLLIPTVGKHIFKNGDLQYALAIPTGVPVPTNLTVICTVKELNCAIPNCTLIASQWYDVKYRKRNKGSLVQRKISAYCAKQIPICLNHHLLIHSGKYDGPSIRKLPGYIPSEFNL